VKKVFIIPFVALLVLLAGVHVLASDTKQLVKGTVYWDQNRDEKYDRNEPGIANVCVSNGREVVKTDKRGQFSLPAYAEMTVFVTKPADYEFPLNENNIPQFSYIHQPNGSPAEIVKYQALGPTGALPEAINFPLFKSKNCQNFKAIIMGDTQVYDHREIGYLRDSAIKELSISKANFVLAMGDNVGDDLSLYPRYLSVMRGIKLPLYLVPGNHDLNYDSPDDAHSFDTFKREFGPTYYSFNYGKVHFVVLDSVFYPSPFFSTATQKTYHGEIDARQMEWLRNDLAYVPADHLIVINMHIPLVSLLDRLSKQHQVRNRSELYSLMKGRKVLTLAGHTHTTEQFLPNTIEDGWGQPTPFHQMIIGAACGSWWSGDFDDAGIPASYQKCGTPRGYFDFTFVGNQYQAKFKATGKSSRKQMALSFATKSFNAWSDQLQAWLAQDVSARTAAPPVNINDLPDQGSIPANELSATSLVANVWNGRSDHTVCCQFDRGQPVKAVRSQTVSDPFALRQQLCVLRYAIGFNIWNNEVKPAAPQPLSSLLATSSTHIWTCPLPEKLSAGIHCVKVTVYDRHHQLLYSDLLHFEVTGGPK
jgi:3',5'-cyclic AMP phosphodiesterase CpdA